MIKNHILLLLAVLVAANAFSVFNLKDNCNNFDN